jgi:hypothetical protein
MKEGRQAGTSEERGWKRGNERTTEGRKTGRWEWIEGLNERMV